MSESTATPVEITTRPEPGRILLKAPRRGKPSKHLADFDLAGRKEFLKELGHPASGPASCPRTTSTTSPRIRSA